MQGCIGELKNNESYFDFGVLSTCFNFGINVQGFDDRGSCAARLTFSDLRKKSAFQQTNIPKHYSNLITWFQARYPELRALFVKLQKCYAA